MLSAENLIIINIGVVLIRIFKYCYLPYLLIIMHSN